MAAYEERLILFIDFLGFKELVDATVSNANELDRLVEALAVLREVGMEQEVFPTQQMTHFSDSVALSFRIDEPSAVFWLLTQIGLAILALAERGYLVRGAVTVGPLYHTEDILVGPAMVSAYHMESKVAIYPRVIVDPAIIEIARENRSDIHHPDEEEKYVRSGLATADDGQLWIDYISFTKYLDAGAEHDAYPIYLERIGRIIREGLVHPEISVVRKYAWLHPHYVEQVELFAGAPRQQNETLEDQRLYVATLPVFAQEMSAASARIARDDANKAELRSFVRCWVDSLAWLKRLLRWPHKYPTVKR
jgi:hypothetical protein